jgi:integrase
MIERQLERTAKDPSNGGTLMRYYHSRVAEGISPARIFKCLSTLGRLSAMVGMPFENAVKDDIVRVVSRLEASDLSPWAKRDYKVILKGFYKWLRNWEDGMPPEVRWMKRIHHAENKRPIMPHDLLTPDERMAMLKAACNLRDRALLEVMFESGRRPEEILTLHIGEVEFDERGAKLHVTGKVGGDVVRIISSARALAIWLDYHPSRDDKDSPVWIGLGSSNGMKQISYVAASSLVKKIARRAGIRKRVTLYLFRHTRIDESLGLLTEAQQNMMFGWRFGSRMPATYMKRYGKHIDDAQSIMNGISPQSEERARPLGPRRCPRCDFDNSPASKFCNRCGNVLDAETAIKMDEANALVTKLIEQIADDPAKMEKLARLVKR